MVINYHFLYKKKYNFTMKKTNIETRNNGYMITRSLEDSSRHVEGYAVVFDSLSED